jgi:putative phosphoribosyl transferase
MLRAEADEVACLYEPDPFLAVGLYYQDFVPTGDAEIQRNAGGGAGAGPRPASRGSCDFSR